MVRHEVKQIPRYCIRCSTNSPRVLLDNRTLVAIGDVGPAALQITNPSVIQLLG